MQDLNTLKQALAAAEAAYKADSEKVKAMRAYDRVANEGGEGYSTAEAASESLSNKHWPIIKAAKAALFAATWTPEYFAARKAEWNAAVPTMKTTKDLLAAEKRLGFTHQDLKDAKALLGA